jgi:hypothetical protein
MAVIYIHVKHGCASGCTAALLLVVCWCRGAVALLPYKAVLCCNRALQLSNESNKGASWTGIPGPPTQTTSQRLHLLEKLEWADLEKLKPHPDLLAEMARLQDLQRQTLARWHATIN